MDVVMPQLGETVAEGTVMVWHKKVGDRVEANELLFEVGTDKVETEIPAAVGGTITEIRVAEGETVDVGVVLAVIDDGGAETKADALAPTPAPAPAPAGKGDAANKAEAGPGAEAAGGRLSPVVKRLLGEHGLAAADITGTGRAGRITRGDVLAHVAASGGAKPAPAPAAAAAAGGGEVIPFNLRRKLTAEHMIRSQSTSAHVLQAVEADFHAVDAVRKRHGEAWKSAENFSLTYLPFAARAVCLAIADYPRVNASVEGESLVVHGAIHLAIAVDLDFDGLVAPVIRDAGSMPLAELARAINDVAVRARTGKLSPDELVGGTYTISNAGTFGTLITAPVINQPQVAILSTDGVTRKPVVVSEGGEEMIAIRPIGVLAQSFDHRAIDGAYSAAFLKRLKDIIEGRDWEAELSAPTPTTSG